jgi:hypothetical protein
MKKLTTLCFILLWVVFAFAQTPQLMGYQAIIRNTNNQLVVNNSVGFQVSILQGSATGSSVYVERHFPKTNANGLVSINVGGGTTVSGVFGSINWANGPYFLKTETDLNGGSNYTISGTSQLLSVPFALSAKTAETAVNATNAVNATTAKTAETADYTKLTNKPALATVATSGNFKDLTNKPSLVVVGWIEISNTGEVLNGSGNFTVTKSVNVYGVKIFTIIGMPNYRMMFAKITSDFVDMTPSAGNASIYFFPIKPDATSEYRRVEVFFLGSPN